MIVNGEPYDRKLWDNGFYERQRAGRGTFLDSADVALHRAAGLAAMVRTEPRVRVERRDDQQFAFSSVAGRACLMHVYVDGVHQQAATAGPRGSYSSVSDLRAVVDPASIYAMEIYPTDVSVPSRFRRLGSASGAGGARIPSPGRPMTTPAPSADPNGPCGAIVIWTKPVYADSTR